MHRLLATIKALIRLARPAQWVKNVFVFCGLVFGARLHDHNAQLLTLLAFVVFCMLSSAVYAFNDLLDYREDALHPTKKNRPVASGALSPSLAGALAVMLAIGGLLATVPLPAGFRITASGYLALNFFYTLWGKHRVLLDVILIAIGFVLRALAGAQAISVDVSAWMVICTFTLCLFLGFGKRRCEIATMESTGNARHHRRTLAHYTPNLLNQLLSTSGGIAVVTFLLYTLDPHTYPHTMVFTTPLVFYAIFRYATVIELGERTGPTDVLINDKPFLVTAILWTMIVLGLIVAGPRVDKYLPQLRYPGTPPSTYPAR